MKATQFEYHSPATIDETVALLAELGDAKVIAGGQSFVPLLALRLASFEHLVDLRKVEGIRGVEDRGDEVWIGAATTQAVVERSATVAAKVPLLSRAIPLIGHFQIRNRGTIGGSLAHADPASELPAVAVALDATFEAASTARTTRHTCCPVLRRHVHDCTRRGRTAHRYSVPRLVGPLRIRRGRGGPPSRRLRHRRSLHRRLTQLADDTINRCAIGLFGLGSTPIRAHAAEASVIGMIAGEVDATALGRLVVSHLTNIPTDLNGSATYRARIGATVVSRATTRALQEAQHG